MRDRRARKANQHIRFLFAFAILNLLGNLVKSARNECLIGIRRASRQGCRRYQAPDEETRRAEMEQFIDDLKKLSRFSSVLRKTTRTSPVPQVQAADRAVDRAPDREAADAAPPVPKAVSPVSAVAEPALPAAAEAAPVFLVAQDPGTRAPRQVCYRWHSPRLTVESPGHREWPQSGKDSTVVRGNKYVRFVSGVSRDAGPRQRIEHTHGQRLRGALPLHRTSPFFKTRVMQSAVPHRLAPRRNFVTRRCVRLSFPCSLQKESAQKNRSRLVIQHVIHNAVRKYRCSLSSTS
jgi:hypothetical protein